MVRGFWADIVMSPYWGFGITVDCCSACGDIMNRVVNTTRVNVHTTQHSTDIAHYNVRRIITRLEKVSDFHFPPDEDRYAQYHKRREGEEVPPVVDEEILPDTADCLLPGLLKLRVKITLLTGDLKTLQSKQRFRGLFDEGVIGPAATFALGPALSPLFKPEAAVYVETLKYIPHSNYIVLSPEEKARGLESIRKLTGEAGWTEVEEKFYYLKYRTSGS